MNSKDVEIMQLEKQLAANKFDNKQLLKECRALFPTIASLSITKSTLITQKDSLIPLTAVIYDSPRSLNLRDQQKLRNWLNQRLMVKDVELFKKQ